MTRGGRALGLMVVAALAACPGGDPATDAGPIDARVVDAVGIDGDGDAMPRVCEASPPPPSQATTAGSVLGRWDLTWTCAAGCVGNRPGLTYARQVDITADALSFSSATCVKCLLTHAAAPAIPGCVDVAAGADWDVQCRYSYRLCERGGTVEATITWQEPGLGVQTWTLVGTR